MKLLQRVLFVVILLFVGTICGCLEQRYTTAEMEAIDYSSYGPRGHDIANY